MELGPAEAAMDQPATHGEEEEEAAAWAQDEMTGQWKMVGLPSTAPAPEQEPTAAAEEEEVTQETAPTPETEPLKPVPTPPSKKKPDVRSPRSSKPSRRARSGSTPKKGSDAKPPRPLLAALNSAVRKYDAVTTPRARAQGTRAPGCVAFSRRGHRFLAACPELDSSGGGTASRLLVLPLGAPPAAQGSGCGARKVAPLSDSLKRRKPGATVAPAPVAQLGLAGRVNAFVLHPRLELMFVATESGRVIGWDFLRQEQRFDFKGHSASVNDCCFGGRFLATCSDDKTLRALTVKGRQVWVFKEFRGRVTAVQAAAQGSFIAFVTTSSDRAVRGVGMDGVLVWKRDVAATVLNCAAQRFVLAAEGGVLMALTCTSGEELWRFRRHKKAVRTIAVGASDAGELHTVFSGGDDKTVRAVDPSGKQLWSSSSTGGHEKALTSIVVAPAPSQYLITGGRDKSVRMLSQDSGRELWSFSGHDAAVSNVEYEHGSAYSVGRDGRVFALSAADGTDRWLWRADTEASCATMVGGSEPRMFTAIRNGGLICCRLPTGEQMWSHPIDGLCRSLRVHSDRIYIASDTLVAVSLDFGNKLWKFEGVEFGVTAVAAGGSSVYVGGGDNSIRRVSKSKGAQSWMFVEHTDKITALALGTLVDKHDSLFSSSEDGTVRKIRTKDGTQDWELILHKDSVTHLAFTGKLLFSASRDCSVRAIDAQLGTKLARIKYDDGIAPTHLFVHSHADEFEVGRGGAGNLSMNSIAGAVSASNVVARMTGRSQERELYVGLTDGSIRTYSIGVGANARGRELLQYRQHCRALHYESVSLIGVATSTGGGGMGGALGNMLFSFSSKLMLTRLQPLRTLGIVTGVDAKDLQSSLPRQRGLAWATNEMYALAVIAAIEAMQLASLAVNAGTVSVEGSCEAMNDVAGCHSATALFDETIAGWRSNCRWSRNSVTNTSGSNASLFDCLSFDGAIGMSRGVYPVEAPSAERSFAWLTSLGAASLQSAGVAAAAIVLLALVFRLRAWFSWQLFKYPRSAIGAYAWLIVSAFVTLLSRLLILPATFVLLQPLSARCWRQRATVVIGSGESRWLAISDDSEPPCWHEGDIGLLVAAVGGLLTLLVFALAFRLERVGGRLRSIRVESLSHWLDWRGDHTRRMRDTHTTRQHPMSVRSPWHGYAMVALKFIALSCRTFFGGRYAQSVEGVLVAVAVAIYVVCRLRPPHFERIGQPARNASESNANRMRAGLDAFILWSHVGGVFATLMERPGLGAVQMVLGGAVPSFLLGYYMGSLATAFKNRNLARVEAELLPELAGLSSPLALKLQAKAQNARLGGGDIGEDVEERPTNMFAVAMMATGISPVRGAGTTFEGTNIYQEMAAKHKTRQKRFLGTIAIMLPAAIVAALVVTLQPVPPVPLPCVAGEKICDKNARCFDQLEDQTYRCVCERGFFGNGTYCGDIDECAATNETGLWSQANGSVGIAKFAVPLAMWYKPAPTQILTLNCSAFGEPRSCGLAASPFHVCKWAPRTLVIKSSHNRTRTVYTNVTTLHNTTTHTLVTSEVAYNVTAPASNATNAANATTVLRKNVTAAVASWVMKPKVTLTSSELTEAYIHSEARKVMQCSPRARNETVRGACFAPGTAACTDSTDFAATSRCPRDADDIFMASNDNKSPRYWEDLETRPNVWQKLGEAWRITNNTLTCKQMAALSADQQNASGLKMYRKVYEMGTAVIKSRLLGAALCDDPTGSRLCCKSCSEVAIAEFKCKCRRGWSSQTCAIDTDECAGSPCVNGAVCRESRSPNSSVALGDFACDCKPGFAGKTCAIDVDECAGGRGPCDGNGTLRCEHSQHVYTVAVPVEAWPFYGPPKSSEVVKTLYTGLFKTKVRGGTSPTAYKCHCRPGYSGTTCGVYPLWEPAMTVLASGAYRPFPRATRWPSSSPCRSPGVNNTVWRDAKCDFAPETSYTSCFHTSPTKYKSFLEAQRQCVLANRDKDWCYGVQDKNGVGNAFALCIPTVDKAGNKRVPDCSDMVRQGTGAVVQPFGRNASGFGLRLKKDLTTSFCLRNASGTQNDRVTQKRFKIWQCLYEHCRPTAFAECSKYPLHQTKKSESVPNADGSIWGYNSTGIARMSELVPSFQPGQCGAGSTAAGGCCVNRVHCQGAWAAVKLNPMTVTDWTKPQAIWAACSKTCTDAPPSGVQTALYTQRHAAANGGAACPFKDQQKKTRPCTFDYACAVVRPRLLALTLTSTDMSKPADLYATGLNFLPGGSSVLCRFGSKETTGVYMNTTRIRCRTPIFAAATRVSVEVSVNGSAGFTAGSGQMFACFDVKKKEPTVFSLNPPASSLDGGNMVTLRGVNIVGGVHACHLFNGSSLVWSATAQRVSGEAATCTIKKLPDSFRKYNDFLLELANGEHVSQAKLPFEFDIIDKTTTSAELTVDGVRCSAVKSTTYPGWELSPASSPCQPIAAGAVLNLRLVARNTAGRLQRHGGEIFSVQGEKCSEANPFAPLASESTSPNEFDKAVSRTKITDLKNGNYTVVLGTAAVAANATFRLKIKNVIGQWYIAENLYVRVVAK